MFKKPKAPKEKVAAVSPLKPKAPKVEAPPTKVEAPPPPIEVRPPKPPAEDAIFARIKAQRAAAKASDARLLGED